MDSRNRVTVHICGQEYTLVSDSSRERILQIADYVDGKMREIVSKDSQASKGDAAVLTAINVADDYFKLYHDTQNMRNRDDKLEKDVMHFTQLWEEAKKSFVLYKEETQRKLDELEARNQDLTKRIREHEIRESHL